jgi:hypothetical protein
MGAQVRRECRKKGIGPVVFGCSLRSLPAVTVYLTIPMKLASRWNGLHEGLDYPSTAVKASLDCRMPRQ